MKRTSSWFVVGFVIFLAAISVGLYYAGLGFFNHYTGTTDKPAPVVQCAQKGTSHFVNITGNVMQPAHTTAKLCDTLTITNRDNTLRLVAFGPHEHHIPYDDVGEKVLDQNQSLTVTLNQAGNFTFHDHLHDSLIGTFTVTP